MNQVGEGRWIGILALALMGAGLIVAGIIALKISTSQKAQSQQHLEAAEFGVSRTTPAVLRQIGIIFLIVGVMISMGAVVLYTFSL